MAPGRLEITVFITGAAVLIIEILGSRLLAPFLGTSLLTWTSIIGVILASLSFGYHFGGRLADKSPSEEQLAFLIFVAGAFVAFTPLLLPFAAFLAYALGPILGSLSSSLLLFAIPSMLLGAVSPYAVKLRTHSLAQVGRSAGDLYAISTIGSIMGAFATGFYLIPTLGSRSILLSVSALLLLLAVMLAGKRVLPFALSLLILSFFSPLLTRAMPAIPGYQILYEADSQYYHTTVLQSARENARLLLLDKQLASGMLLEGSEFYSPYAEHARFAYSLKPSFENILFIGLGGGVEPSYVARAYPRAHMDVVEIDPALPLLAGKFFNFKEGSASMAIEDARTFLLQAGKKYDMVRVDAFNSEYSIPFHLSSLLRAKSAREARSPAFRRGIQLA